MGRTPRKVKLQRWRNLFPLRLSYKTHRSRINSTVPKFKDDTSPESSMTCTRCTPFESCPGDWSFCPKNPASHTSPCCPCVHSNCSARSRTWKADFGDDTGKARFGSVYCVGLRGSGGRLWSLLCFSLSVHLTYLRTTILHRCAL